MLGCHYIYGKSQLRLVLPNVDGLPGTPVFVLMVDYI